MRCSTGIRSERHRLRGVREAARAWHERPFLHVTAETARALWHRGRHSDYGEAAAAVDAIADRYAAAGYGIGHRVGLMLENRPAAFLHWFALNRLGTSVVPLHSDLRPAELAYLMRHSGSASPSPRRSMYRSCAGQAANAP